MSDLYVWRYNLKSVGQLNSVANRLEHSGALIRVNEGYGCIHPWPELGDAPIEEQLKRLQKGETSPLISQAKFCAGRDGEARRAGKSLFETPVPESHWLVLPGDDPAEARAQGFSIAKIKVGSDLGNVIRKIMVWSAAGFRLRLDANEVLSLPTFLDFWSSLKPVRNSIDWVEDPTPWHRGQWSVLREAAVPLAVDRDVETRFESGDTAVVKPAVSSWLPPQEERFLVTSYMDHAIGQAWAAAEGARLAQVPEGTKMLEAGLLTHRCFEADEFFERVSVKECRYQSSGGIGLGFDDLLEKLPWKRLD